MTDRLVVVVHGEPAPQGSKRHVGRGVLVESSAKVAPWRAVVTHAAAETVRAAAGWDLGRLDPIEVLLVFTIARPASHYRTGKRSHEIRDTAPEHPATRPDLDKLIRSTLDGLVDGGALVDDARVVDVHAVKTYPGGHLDSLVSPGAVIVLRAAT